MVPLEPPQEFGFVVTPSAIVGAADTVTLTFSFNVALQLPL